MIFKGQCITIDKQQSNIAVLTFNHASSSVNKFNRQTLQELYDCVRALKTQKDIQGLLVTSAKKDFIVGADITEFHDYFDKVDEELIGWLLQANETFNAVEDLPFPTVTLINGNALGGGFEMCLSTDYRVMASTATVGLPEVKLGIFPGFGGTVRLPRLIGADNAIEWICTANTHKAEDALKMHAVDEVVEQNLLEESGYNLLSQCIEGKLNWHARRKQKTSPLTLSPIESMMVFETAKGFVKSKAGPHYPSPVSAIKTMQQHAELSRDDAIKIEAKNFIKMAKTPVARNLINLFLNDQFIKKKSKKIIEDATVVKRCGVVGAGIMGGGIAYQAACKKVPVVMKDLVQQGIDHGMEEATKLLNKQIERKKISTAEMGKVLSNITPTLHYADFDRTDIVIEAVVENEQVKCKVLKEIEENTAAGTTICSNTSTLSVTRLAKSLNNPENFCGMHFFNPVHRMPLVEVIRGEKSSKATVAKTVALAQRMGKTPIVVKDCPGFFVNRVLFPYFAGFAYLVYEGVDFTHIDKVMEKFGWPMGPAYLLDVVGLDTAVHAQAIMAEGFPERMKSGIDSAVSKLAAKKRFGQKNGAGFYQYAPDKKGKPTKQVDELVNAIIYEKPLSENPEDELIIQRIMIPMAMEAVRCLEEGIIGSPAEADMALVFGLGFPPFLGGIFHYIDDMGLKKFVELADGYAHLDPVYEPTSVLRTLAKKQTTLYAHYQESK